ncbi:rod shape-determining protein MreC [Oceanomicrobium pacificus]|uniref:Cell shape-determining protein MreC n=1 Tax=Oceanomicrobium pacificus TaxID=2692916 RepID=A0A6B0TJN0_9RHOB|nr:rod shape-determining protein MreC [Oceanomicrobium pacificus]MXU64647.1 rod shape-determining protein MreC [Oceanomicrobium pacificus]
MSSKTEAIPGFWLVLRRLLLAGLCLLLLGTFLIWRIDSPRVERFRMAMVDRAVPLLDWTLSPLSFAAGIVSDFQSYARVYEQNQELRRELQRMRDWQEVAIQLEQKNARLRALNNVRLSPRLSYVTGEVLTDSGSPFHQSALINIGLQDEISDGMAAMDDLGLVGRISGIGQRSARIVFITDINSRVPVLVQPSGQRGIVSGDNSGLPVLEFLEEASAVQAGDRVITSGDGGVFPSDLLVGQVLRAADGRLLVRPAADFRRLEYLRVLRTVEQPRIEGPGNLILPPSEEQSRAGPLGGGR